MTADADDIDRARRRLSDAERYPKRLRDYLKAPGNAN